MVNRDEAPQIIMLVRHGEKPGEGSPPHGVNKHGERDEHSLSVQGWTRAGALAAKAGFLALNVTKNQQVAALAAQYDVREAPATLVFTRGPRVAYRVAGYMDRQAVAQAAADAHR